MNHPGNARRRAFVLSLLVLLLAVACRKPDPSGGGTGTSTAQAPAKMRTIAVANYGAHPIIDVTIAAFKKRLVELGYSEGATVRIEWGSVEGDVNIAPQMISGLLAKSPDVIVSITTPISQAVVKQARGRVPVVFCGVTDPVSAKLVPSWENAKGSGVTGTSDRWPYAEQLDIIKEIVPKAHRVGVPYNSGESNSTYALAELQKLAPPRGLEIVPEVVTDVGTVRKAVDSLIARRVDVLYATSDNTVMAGFEAVLKVAYERKVPVIVGESANVERGGLATYSVDYTELGRGTADLVDRVLKGAEPGGIPVLTFKGAQAIVNPDAAERMGVQIPAALLGRAKVVHTKTN